jgi:hypothetical protein
MKSLLIMLSFLLSLLQTPWNYATSFSLQSLFLLRAFTFWLLDQPPSFPNQCLLLLQRSQLKQYFPETFPDL